MSNYYYEPKKKDKNQSQNSGGYYKKQNDNYYEDYQPKNSQKQYNEYTEYQPKQSQPTNTNQQSSNQDSTQNNQGQKKKLKLQQDNAFKPNSSDQSLQNFINSFPGSNTQIQTETPKQQSGSYGYVNEAAPKQSYGYVEAFRTSSGYVNESSNKSSGYVNESSSRTSGGYVDQSKSQSSRPQTGYINESQNRSSGYKNESQKSSGGYVYEARPQTSNDNKRTSGGYVNESSKSTKESYQSGGVIYEPKKPSSGYVNESSKTSGGYVNESSKTSSGYVNEASKSSGGYVNEAPRREVIYVEESKGNRDYQRDVEDYFEEGEGGYMDEENYDDDDYGYDIGREDYGDENDNYGYEDGGDDAVEDIEGENYTEEGYDANAEIQVGYKRKEEKYRPTPSSATPVVIMVAEKPSIAKSISEAISGGKYKQRKGVSKFCPVYEFNGTFKKQHVHFKVTSVAGHVYSTDFPRQFQDWKKIDPYDLFKVNTIKKEANPKSRLCLHLRKEGRNATYCVLWLDNDKEGENICFEVLENIQPVMYTERFQQIYRARFSSIVNQDLVAAFENLHEEPNVNESMSVDARQVIDLKIGVAFSRFQTLYFTQKYPQLNARLISYGPCQTPTLGFCVARHDEILTFKPRTFYRVVPTIGTSNGQFLELMWDNEKTFNPNEATKIKAEVESIREVTVTDFSSKESSKGRPEALNTVHLLKICSSNLGIGPQATMHIAERLYLNGYLTYPRTESTSYPGKFDFKGVTAALGRNPEYTQFCSGLLSERMKYPKAGKDAGDHPPITPTSKVATKGSLRGDEWRVYEYVCRHFLATISPDGKFLKKSVSFQCGNQRYSITGISMIDPGFTEITPWVKIVDNVVPDFKIGQKVPISVVDIKTGETQPPDYLTESELIGLMEKHGIGTDASMATHINNICERNYVEVGNGRRLVPTEVGISLVHGYQKIDPELVAPTLRSNIEKQCDLIARGKADYDTVLNEVITLFGLKYVFFKENISAMDAFFGGNFKTYEDAVIQSKGFSKCGTCNRLMKLVKEFNKLTCEVCKTSHDLPKNGTYKLLGDRQCPYDNFQLILFTSITSQNAKYYVCPKCFNDSPLPEVAANLSCNLCTNIKCQYSVPHNSINICPKCKKGTVVLDQNPGVKPTGSCNYCTYHLIVGDQINLATLKKDKCTCGANKFDLKFREKVAGLNDVKYDNICIFCHSEYSKYLASKNVEKEVREDSGHHHPRFKKFGNKSNFPRYYTPIGGEVNPIQRESKKIQKPFQRTGYGGHAIVNYNKTMNMNSKIQPSRQNNPQPRQVPQNIPVLMNIMNILANIKNTNGFKN